LGRATFKKATLGRVTLGRATLGRATNCPCTDKKVEVFLNFVREHCRLQHLIFLSGKNDDQLKVELLGKGICRLAAHNPSYPRLYIVVLLIVMYVTLMTPLFTFLIIFKEGRFCTF
jgi:hypothetical protein